MFDALERNEEWGTDTDLTMGASRTSVYHQLNFISHLVDIAEEQALVNNICKVTDAQLRMFLHLAWVKYVKARIEPGACDACGVSEVMTISSKDPLWGRWERSQSASLAHR